ncbi:MAG: ribonuclease Y, partial [Fimbriimonas sp.]
MNVIDGLGGFLVGGVAVGALYFGVFRPRRKQALAELLRESQTEAERVLLEAREEALRIRDRVDEELRQREAKVFARDEALETRRARLDELESSVRAEKKQLEEKLAGLDDERKRIDAELTKVAGLEPVEAQEMLLKRLEGEFREVGLRRARQAEHQAASETERRAKKLLIDAMQRSVVDYVTEATLAVVELPSEDMKGRIIGRDGRNIRAFEQVTGVDLIVDETPEAVVVSCFDPVRRETARLALMNLMLDGRIHPGRIEELYEKAKGEVERTIDEAGRRALERANVADLHPKALEVLGRLRFRTSFGQNVLDHSVEVSRLAVSLASEIGLDVEVAKRAGLLHDIGKALGPEWEGPHALTGMEFLSTLGESPEVLHAVGAHHYEIEPTTAEAVLVILGDTISASRPGARRESLDNHVQRLTALEDLANGLPGVDRAYAVKAGREVRIIVKPTEVDDLGAAKLAHTMAQRVEAELSPGMPVRVTVIRELRVHR